MNTLGHFAETIFRRCVTIDTPVLTSNLQWVPAGEIEVGTKILAFEEERSKKFAPRYMRTGVVTHNRIEEAECVEIQLSNGEILRCTPDHAWLVRRQYESNLEWVEARNLTTKHCFSKYMDVLPPIDSYKSGYLAAAFDGEGSLDRSRALTFSQVDNEMFKLVKQYLDEFDFKYSVNLKSKGALSKQECFDIRISDNVQVLRFLSVFRPPRLLKKFEELRDTMSLYRRTLGERASVVEVRPIGIQKIAVISTSTKTHITAGYPSHNTYAVDDKETWEECAYRVAKFVAGDDEELHEKFYDIIRERKFMPGGRYLAQAGREVAQLTNCFLFRATDSREGWSQLLYKHMMALSTGGGCGTYYGDIRPSGTPIKRFGGVASGPISLMFMVNEVARHVLAGGKRRSALWAGLPWNHKDVEAFIGAKNWTTAVKALKEQDFNYPAPLDMTNISVCLDDEFFEKVKTDPEVFNLYYRIVKSMCKTGEPGFSIDVGKNKADKLRNPCTEVVSDTDSDCCNLGSINLARIGSIEELKEVTRLATRFLYLGTFRSWLPHDDIAKVRESNRRIGLGIMGLHEWCMRNNERYEPNGELGKWLACWANISDDEATKFAKKMKSVRPIAVRAIAPTGTIGIIAETTTGIEPVYCVAYKRRFLGNDGVWQHEYVIDPTVKRLLAEGVIKDPNEVEDAITLSKNVERRIRMQAFVQAYVDQAISSTINLPEWGEPGNNNAMQFAKTLLEYLPKLRGITCYPDASRAGQPITAVKWETALKHQPKAEESDEKCAQGVCGM